MANAEQIRKICSIITSDPERRLIVVSAPGKRFDSDTKITDLLIQCAERFLKGEDYEEVLQNIVSRFREISADLGLGNQIVVDIENNLRTRLSMDYDSDEKFMDRMKAAGEDNAARLVAYYLKSTGYQAQYLNPKDAGLFLSDEYGNARVLPQSFKNLQKIRSLPGIIIFPGFFGYSLSGDVFIPKGRLGYHGLSGHALEVDVYSFTDVNSVFAASPEAVGSQPIAFLYREMRACLCRVFGIREALSRI